MQIGKRLCRRSQLNQEDFLKGEQPFKQEELKIGSLAHSIEKTFKITILLGYSRRREPYAPILANL